MDYGTERSTIRVYRNGEETRTLKHYKVRVKVNTTQDEMTEFIRFTDQLNDLRSKGNLTFDKEDPSTRPAFIIDYPKDNIDGSYFIIKSYTILV